VNNLPKILHVTPHVTSPIPWVILKSPVSERHTTRFSSTTVRPSTAAKKPATKSAGPSSTRVSTVRPTSPTVRQETKQQSTTTRKSGTKVSLTTKSPVLNGPNSNSKAATNGVRPIALNDDVIIDEAISDITSHQLEEIKREAEIIQQK
jgi:hypothetical protein